MSEQSSMDQKEDNAYPELQPRDIVVIGASAGGVEAILQLTSKLPADLAAAVFIVLHIPAYSSSLMPDIISRRSSLRAVHPNDGDPIEHGAIYVAPPDHHLLVGKGEVRLWKGPRENRSRPAIDPLFRSAARQYTNRVTAIVLTGTLNDGTAGMITVQSFGGTTIVQDPSDALYSEMPQSVMDNITPDRILKLQDIPAAIIELVRTPVEAHHIDRENTIMHENLVRRDITQQELNQRDGLTSMYTCPDCGGVLWEADEGELLHFRCHLGHAMTAETLLESNKEATENALWSAVRSLTEKAILSKQLATRMRERGSTYSALRFEE